MQLEILHRAAQGRPGPMSFLCVHGANSGAWVWDAHILPALAARGWDAWAVSLRGHGASEGRDFLPFWGIDHYVADVVRTMELIGGPVVVVGHSMGGFVVQKLLQSQVAAGAVLMASVPPMGLLHTAWDMAWRDPWLLQQTTWVQSIGGYLPGATDVVKRLLFSRDVADADVAPYQAFWQQESVRAVWDMMGGNLPWRARTATPVLVMGAENDAFVPPNVAEATANHYGADLHILPDMAHAMMLERGWENVVDHLVEWTDGLIEPVPYRREATVSPA